MFSSRRRTRATTIKISSQRACSSFSSVASVFSYTYLVPVIYKASNLVQVNIVLCLFLYINLLNSRLYMILVDVIWIYLN